jgi:putative N6-adenine-specific DNA methylase
LYIDTSGEPLFKRGWRQDKGDAPLKETLAAALLAACGWWQPAERRVADVPLYDPCCGSGTIVIEAAQLALGLPAGGQRRFAFEHLRPFDSAQWNAVKKETAQDLKTAVPQVFGSDVAHRMVDFAQRNAERAGVARAVQLRGGDALQRLPPTERSGVILMNPPYGERIAAAGVAGRGREAFQTGTLARGRADGSAADINAGDEFFTRLAAHWKTHYAGWTAWLLTPDPQLPARLRLKVTRRVPLWNGPIECRLLRFELTARTSPK